jgi:Uma2 family endonuclease
LVPRQWAVPDPLVIIEVLSPTTEAEDRGVKLVDYRHIDSVQAILLVASEIKRVEFWRRRENAWTVVELEAGDSVTLDMLGFDIPVEALYDGLDFTEGAVA